MGMQNDRTKQNKNANQVNEPVAQYRQQTNVDNRADREWSAEPDSYRQWVLARAQLSYQEYCQSPESAMTLGEFKKWLSGKEYLNSK